jgi:hypothetical protein
MGAHYYDSRPSASKNNATPIRFGPALLGMTILVCFVYVVVWVQTVIVHGPVRNLRA